MRKRLTVYSLAISVLLLSCTPSYVGSRDCRVLDEEIMDPALSLQNCEYCQGRACQDKACEWLPCLDGKYIVEGCDEDSECGHLPEAICGRYSAPDHICTVLGDDK
jgi:hypothetical protein